jgi:putative acetyltransferase
MDTQTSSHHETSSAHIRAFEHRDYSAIIDVYAHSKLDELKYETQSFELLPLDQDTNRLTQLQQSDIHVYDHQGVVAYGAPYHSEIRALFVRSNNHREA